MWQTGGPPVLHRIIIVKLLTQHVRRLLGTHQWQSALLVVGLPVTQDWFEMDCHLSPSLILNWVDGMNLNYRSCRTSIPRKRRGKHTHTHTRRARKGQERGKVKTGHRFCRCCVLPSCVSSGGSIAKKCRGVPGVTGTYGKANSHFDPTQMGSGTAPPR